MIWLPLPDLPLNDFHLKKKKIKLIFIGEDFLAVIFLKMPHELFNFNKSLPESFAQGHRCKSKNAASQGDVSFPECQVKNKPKSSM